MLRLVSSILLALVFVSVIHFQSVAQPITNISNIPPITSNSKPVFCIVSDVPYVTAFIEASLGATPLFKLNNSMYAGPSQIIMFGNHNSGLWVLMEFMEGWTCLLGTGISISAGFPNKGL